MNNNNEDHIWITTQRRRARGLGATMLSISQMCKPYVLSEIKRKKKRKKRETWKEFATWKKQQTVSTDSVMAKKKPHERRFLF